MAEQEVIASEKPKLTPDQMIVHDTGEYAMLFDSAKFNQAYRVATAFAQSGLVPDHFKDNPAGVFVVLHMATRLQLDPFMALQKVYMVHGRPGMEAQLVIALVNSRGPFTGPIQWTLTGDGKSRQCTAFATHAKTNELCEATVTWGMVEAEGWSKKTGSKWLTIPDLMFRYRSATFLARLYCPEVILGLSTADELEDTAITLDSGITISHKPRTALPEVPEVDPAAIAEFCRLVNEQKDFRHEHLNDFLSQIAKVNKQTIEAVQAQASTPENFPTFWKSFLAWHKKQDKKGPGRPKNTAPTEAAHTPARSRTPPQATPQKARRGGSAPSISGLLSQLEAVGWPEAKLEIRFGKKRAEWGDVEAKKLADLANE
jgi:hypothetical protein